MGGQLHFNERYPESEDGSRKLKKTETPTGGELGKAKSRSVGNED